MYAHWQTGLIGKAYDRQRVAAMRLYSFGATVCVMPIPVDTRDGLIKAIDGALRDLGARSFMRYIEERHRKLGVKV